MLLLVIVINSTVWRIVHSRSERRGF